MSAFRALRAVMRIALLVILSLLVLLPALLLHAVCRPLSGGGRLPALRAVLGMQTLWSRAALAILGVRVASAGPPPPDRCLLVSNHLGYLDIPVLASRLRCRFVSRADVAHWPLIGLLARAAQTLFIDRGRKRDVLAVGDAIRRTLEAGVSVAFFPEGTSSRGEAVGPFHPGLLEAAASSGAPCLPVAIRYETPGERAPPALTVCWWGDMTFLPHAWNLLLLSRIDAQVRWGAEPLRDADRKRLARALHDRVAAQFEPVRQEPLPCAR